LSVILLFFGRVNVAIGCPCCAAYLVRRAERASEAM